MPTSFGHRPLLYCGEAATTTLNPEPRSLKAGNKRSVVTLLLSPSLGRGTPEGQGVGRGREKPQANLRPFGAPPSKGRRKNRDRASPYLYFTALLYSYAPHQPPLNPLNLLNPPNLFCPQSKDGTPAGLTPNPEPANLNLSLKLSLFLPCILLSRLL